MTVNVYGLCCTVKELLQYNSLPHILSKSDFILGQRLTVRDTHLNKKLIILKTLITYHNK